LRLAKQKALAEINSDLLKIRERHFIFDAFRNAFDLEPVGDVVHHLDKDPLLLICFCIRNEAPVNLQVIRD
jgi:hypothetical protein